MYGWIILEDHIGTDSKGVMGPYDIPEKYTKKFELKEMPKPGEKFKMYDDDGNLYYTGWICGDYDGFEPLDDYGMPNAGCTMIKYRNKETQAWELL